MIGLLRTYADAVKKVDKAKGFRVLAKLLFRSPTQKHSETQTLGRGRRK